MTPQRTYRQGDVLLRERQESPEGLQGEVVAQDAAGARVLAYGEASGHRHQIIDPQARLLKTTDGQRLLVAAAPVSLDESGRLLCSDGPAIEYSDGLRGYCWHGQDVPEQVILHPESITLEQIDQDRNVESRRVLIERYGEARYLQTGCRF